MPRTLPRGARLKGKSGQSRGSAVRSRATGTATLTPQEITAFKTICLYVDVPCFAFRFAQAA